MEYILSSPDLNNVLENLGKINFLYVRSMAQVYAIDQYQS